MITGPCPKRSTILVRMRLVVAFLIGCLIATGCASSTYKIPGHELRRLATVAPEQRGERVRVQQEITDENLGPQQPVTSETQIVFFAWPEVFGPDRRNYYRHRGTWGAADVPRARGGGGGLRISGGGGGGKGDGVALIVIVAVIVVVAAIAVLAYGAIESSRFDGFAKLHPMHPVYLVGSDNSKAVMPLAWIDPQTASWAKHGYVRRTEGPWLQLERAPLHRQGFNLSMFGGVGMYRSLDDEFAPGPATTIQMGVFPIHQLGLVGSLFLGWRKTTPNEYLIDMRYTLEAQFFPLSRGPVQAGVFFGYGGNYVREEVVQGTTAVSAESKTTDLKTGGLLLHLDINTRVALTARFGIANNGDGPTTDAVFGFSVF